MQIIYRYVVITGDGKIVGIFSTIDTADQFIEEFQTDFTSELRYYIIRTDF